MSKSQRRLHTGYQAQLSAATAICNYIPNATLVSVAPPGSMAPDVIIAVDGINLQFEVKQVKNTTRPLVLINKQVKRDTTEVLDVLTQLITHNDISFMQCMDNARRTDKTIGFPSDEGVQISGKLPTILTKKHTHQDSLQVCHSIVTQHLHSKGDNYVAVVDSSTSRVFIFFTGLGQNTIQAPPLPQFASMSLKTYGSPSSKNAGVRIGLNVILDFTVLSTQYSIPL